MKILRESSENEMILEFLKAESTSERFSQQIKKIMEKLDIDENVVSPYSSFLTAMTAPNLSVRNLRRLENYGYQIC